MVLSAIEKEVGMVDEWAEKILNGKYLTEQEVVTLCSKVHISP